MTSGTLPSATERDGWATRSEEHTSELQSHRDLPSFPTRRSSDPLLNRIWELGAYTSHLCMQDDIWDAPKRDRARWMGDLDVSGHVIDAVFADHFLMQETMNALIHDAGQPVDRDVNHIPGYSAFWVM